uniref:Uncharacterized protein LOC107412095 n=1 Tax=Rhizophora mucronata TaxID=61149 RepID=A0A2P2JYY4_RHIMU
MNHSQDPTHMAAAEDVLKLFDSYWSEHTIFAKKRDPSTVPDSETNPVHKIHEKPKELCEVLSLPSTPLIRSLSDQNLSSRTCFIMDSCSPDSVLTTPKLQTVASGVEITEFHQTEGFIEKESTSTSEKIKRLQERRRSAGQKVMSKSLSDLEFEELKGFMDLGFVFSEEDRDSSLVSIIPGLQGLGRKKEEKEEKKKYRGRLQRPYLSEAWNGTGGKKKNPLTNLRIPDLADELNMKEHLRSWAQTVASTVK